MHVKVTFTVYFGIVSEETIKTEGKASPVPVQAPGTACPDSSGLHVSVGNQPSPKE